MRPVAFLGNGCGFHLRVTLRHRRGSRVVQRVCGLGGGIVDVGANRWEKPRLRIPGFAAVVVRLEASIFLLR